jgi:cytosine/uracil/thiamine/allantoin permease
VRTYSELARGAFSVYKFCTFGAAASATAFGILSVRIYNVAQHLHQHQHLPIVYAKWWLGLALSTYVFFTVRKAAARRMVRYYDRAVIGNIARNVVGIKSKDRNRFGRVKAKYE